jgi:hypothetical protein
MGVAMKTVNVFSAVLAWQVLAAGCKAGSLFQMGITGVLAKGIQVLKVRRCKRSVRRLMVS